jgi:hypothetical protein
MSTFGHNYDNDWIPDDIDIEEGKIIKEKLDIAMRALVYISAVKLESISKERAKQAMKDIGEVK